MARPLRIEYAGAFYHVLNRGQRREPIVRDGQDCERFVSDLSKLAQQYGVLIHGYCLMTNHYHLILETPHANLSQAVQWLNVAYATYYNRRHHLCGHLFQGRFKAILLDGGPYLEAVSRYIHLNPVRAGIVADARRYSWSSCRYFVGADKAPDWLQTRQILGGFAPTVKAAQRRYGEYLAEPAVDPFADVVAGSILGSPTFTEWVKNTFLARRIADPEIPALKVLQARPSVPRIVQAVAQYYDVAPETILSPGGKRNHRRDVAICLAREFSGLYCRDLGRYFGGIGGPAVTMRCRAILRHAAKDRQLAKDLDRLRHTLQNNE
jgi:REP element-mobilizing transposase RayT